MVPPELRALPGHHISITLSNTARLHGAGCEHGVPVLGRRCWGLHPCVGDAPQGCSAPSIPVLQVSSTLGQARSSLCSSAEPGARQRGSLGVLGSKENRMGLSSSCGPKGQPGAVRGVVGARLYPRQHHRAVLSLPAPQLTLRLSLLSAICFPLPPPCLLSPSPLLFPQASAIWEKQENTIRWRGLCCLGSLTQRYPAGSAWEDGAGPRPMGTTAVSVCGASMCPSCRALLGTCRARNSRELLCQECSAHWGDAAVVRVWGWMLHPGEGPRSVQVSAQPTYAPPHGGHRASRRSGCRSQGSGQASSASPGPHGSVPGHVCP